MSELQTLKKQLSQVASRYTSEIRAARDYYESAALAQEESEVLAEELDDLRRLDIATKAGKQILAKATEQFRAAIAKAKEDQRKFNAKAQQSESEADDQYGLAEKIYSRIGEYDDRFKFPAAFDETA